MRIPHKGKRTARWNIVDVDGGKPVVHRFKTVKCDTELSEVVGTVSFSGSLPSRLNRRQKKSNEQPDHGQDGQHFDE